MKHTLSLFEESLQSLQEEISEMGRVVKERLERVVEAMDPWDPNRVREIIGTDDLVNAYEHKIGEKCADILTVHHPMARDLRLVVASLRIATDLERVGDETEKIAVTVIGQSLTDIEKETYTGLVKLAKNVKQKLVLAMHFFSEADASVFKKLSKEDRKTYTISKRVLYKFIGKKEKMNMQHILNIVLFTRSLERIGDHAKNIAEHVIYMSEGRDIRSAETRASDDP